MDFTKQTVKILEGKNEDSLFALQIPNNLLYGWHLQRNDGCRLSEKMNSCIEGPLLMVKDVVEERLRTRAAKIFSNVERGDTKRKRSVVKDKFSTLQIYKGEIELSSNDSLTQQVKDLEDRVEKVTKDALKYKDQCKVMTEVSKVPINQGRSFDEVHECQQKREVDSIKHGSEQALSFVKTFGLSVEKVVLRSPTKIVELTYDLPESSAGCSSSSSTAADKNRH